MRYEQNWEGRPYDPSGISDHPFFPVEVPGNIQYDYAKYLGIEDLQYANTVKRLEETEGFFWEYRTHLSYEAEKGQKIMLVAEGVDYQFDILLDGEKIHSQEGMYTPVQLDVTEKAHPGSLLQFIIHPHPCRPGPYPGGFRQAADQSCKPPVTYGWDWNPRLLISGLWQPVYIETRGRGYIESCEPFYTLNDSLTAADIRFETQCQEPVYYTIRDREGNIVYQGHESACYLENIHLWWCNGQGDPYLYTWTAESSDHKRSGKIGFRTIRLIRNQGADHISDFPKSRYPAGITLELNGRPIFGKGSNWVNPELFFGRITRARYEELLQAAADANMNILRLWGGAGVNKPDFYDLCDEKGLLVWQEFMLACNNYRGTPHYLAVLETEASSIIKALRHHPSLALWCGGNELFNSWSGMDEQSHALRLLNKLCYELDFDRPYLMTSPSAGMGHGGYTFRHYENNLDVLTAYANAHCTAYTEFGVPSLADAELLQKIIPENERFPIERTESWITHHAFDAWSSKEHCCWSCLPMLEDYFGKMDSLERTVKASQWLQATGYQAIFEEARRQWPYCSMAINWCYEEPWLTAANNSLISYPMVKKPGYYAVKEACRPVLASARIPHFDWKGGDIFSAEIWLLNDSNETIQEEITVSLRIGAWEKELLTWKTDPTAPRTNLLGPSIHCQLPNIPQMEEMELCLQAKNSARSSVYRLLCQYHTLKTPTSRLNE
ncbi:MAG: hypothetical protein E7329_10775 [Clostridiales bacterium]|nr:hypothetical protein [Clostridiales bacterium]